MNVIQCENDGNSSPVRFKGYKNSSDPQGVMGTAGTLRAIVCQAGRRQEGASQAQPEKGWSALGVEGLSPWGPDLGTRPCCLTSLLEGHWQAHRYPLPRGRKTETASPHTAPWKCLGFGERLETICKMRGRREVLERTRDLESDGPELN